MITIHTEVNDGEGDIEVFAEMMGERVQLGVFGQTESARIIDFRNGAESILKALKEHQPSPEQVAQMAQEAARAAGVDESTIAQGGVAVGPWGAVSVQYVTVDDDHAEEDDPYLHEVEPVYE